MDRIARNRSVDLKNFNVAFVSLWPGMVRTEDMTGFVGEDDQLSPNEIRAIVRILIVTCLQFASKIIKFSFHYRLPIKMRHL